MPAVPLFVIDTNIVLDVFVFNDAAALPLRAALEAGEARWIATEAMRTELARVLGYPQIAPRLAFYGLTADAVLARYDAAVHTVLPDAPRAPWACKDADDQKFIDLAVAHRAALLSKDRLVLALRKRLVPAGVRVAERYADCVAEAGVRA